MRPRKVVDISLGDKATEEMPKAKQVALYKIQFKEKKLIQIKKNERLKRKNRMCSKEKLVRKTNTINKKKYIKK